MGELVNSAVLENPVQQPESDITTLQVWQQLHQTDAGRTLIDSIEREPLVLPDDMTTLGQPLDFNPETISLQQKAELYYVDRKYILQCFTISVNNRRFADGSSLVYDPQHPSVIRISNPNGSSLYIPKSGLLDRLKAKYRLLDLEEQDASKVIQLLNKYQQDDLTAPLIEFDSPRFTEL